jgi:hypothetical protein
MGSFLMRCSASGQVLQEGAPCYVVPLFDVRHGYRESATLHPQDGKTKIVKYPVQPTDPYIDQWHRPIVGFIKCTADDYGYQRLCTDDTSNLQKVAAFYATLLDHTMVTHQGSNSVHDLAFDITKVMHEHAPKWFALTSEAEPNDVIPPIDAVEAEAVWNELLNSGLRYRMFYKEFEDIGQISFGVVHEYAYKALLQEGEATCSWNGTPMTREALLERSIKKDSKDINALQDPVQSEALFFRQHTLSQTLTDLWRSLNGCSGYILGFHYLPILAAAMTIGKAPVKESVAKLLAALDPYLDDLYVMRGMDVCGIQFQPTSYAGQDYSNEKGQAYAQFIEQVAQQVQEYVGEDDEEDIDEDNEGA